MTTNNSSSRFNFRNENYTDTYRAAERQRCLASANLHLLVTMGTTCLELLYNSPPTAGSRVEALMIR